MSKIVNGGTRSKKAREIYVEQLPSGRGLTPSMNRKREVFTGLNPLDDADLAYRSTPNYLRETVQQTSLLPTEMIIAQNVPRTKSASELTSRNNVNRSMNGNPKYKAQEDYYDEIQSLKKDMKTVKDENSNLRAKIRRLEEDNTRKRKEIDALYDSNKDGDLRRTLSGSTTDRNNNINNTSIANVVMSLKQRLFKLELQLKDKEAALDVLKSDPKWLKGTELEIQNRALYGELERQKVERLNYIQQNDYTATLDEEKKDAIRKLNREKDELKKENESLKRKVQELQGFKPNTQFSARSLDGSNDKELLKKTEDLKHMKRELDQLQDKFDQANEKLEDIKRERDQYKRKLAQPDENLDDIKRERDQYRKKFEQANRNLEEIERERDQYKKKLDQSNEEQHKIPMNLSSTSVKRPQSPTGEKRTPRSSAVNVRQDPYLFEQPIKTTSKPIHSPPSSPKIERPGSGKLNNRSSETNIPNESALKTVQASLRGHLNRSEIDSPSDLTKSNFKQSVPNNMGSNNRDFSSKPRRSPSPPADYSRPPSPQVGSGVGSKQNLPNDRNKPGSDNRFSKHDRDSSPKPGRSSSPSADYPRPPSPQVGSGVGSKQNLPNDRNKPGSDNRYSKYDRDSSPKPGRSSSPSADYPRPSSLQAGSGAGSKQSLPNDRNKPGSDSRLRARNDDLSSKPRESSSPPLASQRSSSPHAASGSGSKQDLPNDRPKLGSGNRFPAHDQDSSKNLQRPSPAAAVPRRIPPENPQPLSKQILTNSKQSLNNIPNDDDDDVVVVGS